VVLHVGPEGRSAPRRGFFWSSGRILPDRIDAQHPAHVAIAGRPVASPATRAGRAAHVPDRAQASGRTERAGRNAARDLVYHRVVQAVEINRLEVGAVFPLGEQSVEQLLHLANRASGPRKSSRGVGQGPATAEPPPRPRPPGPAQTPARVTTFRAPSVLRILRIRRNGRELEPGCRRSRPARLP